MSLSVKLSGTLNVGPANQTVVADGGGPCLYGLELLSASQAATNENSSKTGFVDSPGSFVALPISANMLGVVLYMRAKSGSGVFDVRITSQVSGVQTISQTSLVLLEKAAIDAITLVEVQGNAQFEWSLTGNRSS